MAEIRVERKSGSGKWLWLVLLLVVVAAIVIYLWQSGVLGGEAVSQQVLQQLVPVEAAWHTTNLV